MRMIFLCDLFVKYTSRFKQNLYARGMFVKQQQEND